MRHTTSRGRTADHNFAQIPGQTLPRSVFNRSHGLKTAFDAGWLIPIYSDEALPGDTINLRANLFARLATPIFPVMDNMYLTTFFFAVPIRLIWDNWEKMNGAQDNPGDSTTFLVPQIVSGNPAGHPVGSLADYLGLPTDVPDLTHSSLWHRAYNLIWNEFFRSQDIQASQTVDTDDGPDTASSYIVRRRGKRHDYFTSCLPWPQKGTAVTIPMGTTAPVVRAGTGIPTWKGNDAGADISLAHDGSTINADWTITGGTAGAAYWSVTALEADLTTATNVTINQLRESFQIQKMLEKDARGGTRYTEILKSHFGVTSPDQRLQRPEFLGGGMQDISINAVPQTESSDATTPQGSLAAYGTSFGQNHSFVKSFTEHCVLIGLVQARADLSYQQGLERQFSRRSRFDFYFPSFAHIGEQAVLTKEIYAVGSLDTTDEDVFGYQERYAEYRYKQSRITGIFRSTAAGSLDSWHLAEDFGDPGTDSAPTLSNAFITDDPPVDRVIAVTTEPHFIMDGWFDVKHARPMPTYSVPGMIDHF